MPPPQAVLACVPGKMTMVGMYAAGTSYEVTGKGFDPEARALQFPGKIRETIVPKGMR